MSEKAVCCIFAMIDSPEYVSEQRVDLSKIGIDKNSEKSRYEWRELKPRYDDKSLEALMVIFI